VYLKIGQAFDVNEATSSTADSNEPTGSFGIITGELRIRGLEYVTLDSITTYDPNQNLFLTNYTVLSLADHRGDGLSLDYTWRRGIEEQIYGQIRVRLIPSLEVSYGRRYSVYDNQNLETDYRLLYRHQCWSVEMTYSEIPSIQGNPPENKWLVLFTLMGVGSFGR
jgi:LPS-assembly protein